MQDKVKICPKHVRGTGETGTTNKNSKNEKKRKEEKLLFYIPIFPSEPEFSIKHVADVVLATKQL